MKRPRIVDAHMHLGFPGTLFTSGWETDAVLRLMDLLGMDRAYSIHHLWLTGRIAEGRAASIEAYEHSGGRIPFMAVYDPRRETESLRAMNACLGHEGFIGIKIHPSFHSVPADDRRYDPAWEYASEHKLPMVSHTWSDTYNPVQKLSVPKLFESHIEKHQDVSLIMGHSGGPGTGREQAIRLAQTYPNVYLDLSGDIFSLDLIENLACAVGADKVIFGSDQPWIDPRAHLTRIYLSELDEEAKKLVLGQNALLVFEPHLLSGENSC
ncbi:MAG: amidohydrolase family protein [Candidatus Latescibacterota bacterium]